MDEPIEDGIGDTPGAEIDMPIGDGQLRGDEGRAAAVA